MTLKHRNVRYFPYVVVAFPSRIKVCYLSFCFIACGALYIETILVEIRLLIPLNQIVFTL